MKIVFLGTNGWYDTETGNTTCTLIETSDYYLILDAGNGFYKLNDYIPNIENNQQERKYENSDKQVYLFLSHFHMDHIEGLHSLNKFNFKEGINIYGQLGTQKALNTIINEPYTVPFDILPFEVDIHELDEGQHNIPFSVECRFLPHSSKCLGYRFEIDGKTITYCTDTGMSENAVKLAKNADLLITECSFKFYQSNPEWPHLNPEDAVKIAKDADAKILALTHFDANNYRSIEERDEILTKMKDNFQDLLVAHDNMEIIL
ncbi:MBL fold metallo-hydrolase [Methanobacterium oryzae]|uniref:MBL fold metallo-hydrolase n=1 Tax=Methanobacterium oryzae TaxID=69540 RepID=UPI003D240F46